MDVDSELSFNNNPVQHIDNINEGYPYFISF